MAMRLKPTHFKVEVATHIKCPAHRTVISGLYPPPPSIQRLRPGRWNRSRVAHRLEEVMYDDKRLFLVFEYLELDLKKFMDTTPTFCHDRHLIKVPPPPPSPPHTSCHLSFHRSPFKPTPFHPSTLPPTTTTSGPSASFPVGAQGSGLHHDSPPLRFISTGLPFFPLTCTISNPNISTSLPFFPLTCTISNPDISTSLPFRA